MANTIKLKRGSGSDPSASDLAVGEVAVRTDEGKLFTKKDDGTVAEISGGGSGTTINNNADNRIITGSGTSNTLNAESTFTYDGAGVLTLLSTDTSSSALPIIELYRNSASPADADYLGQLKFTGESDDGSKEVYAKMTAKIDDASSGTEDGLFEFALRKAGSNNIGARLTSTDLKLINGTGLEVAGDTTMTGDLTISNTAPKILLTDTNNDPDYELKNFNGVFELDQGSSDTKFKITTDGHVEFPNDDQEIRIGQGSDLVLVHDGSNSIINDAGQGNLQIQNAGTTILGVTSSGINVTGAIIVSSTVDGRDLATDGSKLDGIESGATADQTKSDIDALGIAASTAATLLTARTIAGVSFDGSANISLNNNAITNGAGYITGFSGVAGGGTFTGAITAPRISGSNGIIEMKQEIGTSQTLTSGYNALSVDPTIANGVTITVPTGAIWSIV